jgi:hypothetical protein
MPKHSFIEDAMFRSLSLSILPPAGVVRIPERDKRRTLPHVEHFMSETAFLFPVKTTICTKSWPSLVTTVTSDLGSA